MRTVAACGAAAGWAVGWVGGVAGLPWVAAAESPKPKPPRSTDWLLSEFDWGDSRSIVRESVLYHPDFSCHMVGGICGGVTADLDGEMFLARFAYGKRGRGLDAVRLLTPDVEVLYAPELERLWRHLAAFYGARHVEPTTSSDAFPDLSALSPDSVRVTHTWELPDHHIRIGVGRRKSERYYVFAAFRNPANVAPEPVRVSEPSPEADAAATP